MSWLGAGEQPQVPQLSFLHPSPISPPLPQALQGPPGISKLAEETPSTWWQEGEWWATRLPGNPNTFQIRGFRAQAWT